MKTVFKSLILLSFTLFANAEETSASADKVPLKPLIEAMAKDGLVSVNAYLELGGTWPRITTDSFAIKKQNHQSKRIGRFIGSSR
jgi:hypothetical protein